MTDEEVITPAEKAPEAPAEEAPALETGDEAAV